MEDYIEFSFGRVPRAEYDHAWASLCDMVPYSDPDYFEKVQNAVVAWLRHERTPSHETDWMIDAHDKALEEQERNEELC